MTYTVAIIKYEEKLDEALHDIECPKCKTKHTSGYWRKVFNYPRGKVIEVNAQHIVCNNCNFEYDIQINLDINEMQIRKHFMMEKIKNWFMSKYWFRKIFCGLKLNPEEALIKLTEEFREDINFVKKAMVNIKELSETPGNCFSCGKLHSFIPFGYFRCRFHGEPYGEFLEFLCDTNNPPKTNCQHWIKKKGQKPLPYVRGNFAGLENY
jgi:uncharacterized protein YbaR (Trm112 family)